MAQNIPLLPALAICGSAGLMLLQGREVFTNNAELFSDSSSSVKVIAFSPDGNRFAFCNGQNLKVLDMSNGETVFEIAKRKTIEIVISPNNTFLACWQQFCTTPKNPQGDPNYEIYNIKTGEVMKSIIQKKQPYWAPVWTSEEKVCARCVSNEIQFYENSNFHTAVTKLYLKGVAGFSISPAKAPYMVAAYVIGKKGSPSFVRLFQYPNFAEGQAIANKSFFKSDKVDMFWNKKGTALLVLVSSEVDTTGLSYYGQQTLHFMSTRGDSNLIPLEKHGPIYSVEWNPNSSQFCVIYGFMPAKATLFNMKCESVFDFGTGPRNVCHFNPHGNILCLAGFGNLHGIMEMWNVDGKKIIAKPQAVDTTYFEWCPDGQHFVTSTLSPRLRVSNGYKIWHYSGNVVHTYQCPNVSELWQTTWQHQPDGLFPVPRIVTSVMPQEVKKEAYRPPSARGTAAKKLVIHETELPENQRNQENLSAAALKNKNKREAKAKSRQETSTYAGTTSPQSTTEFISTGDPETDKKIKGIKKKLKQIEDLKAKKKEGKPLEKNQLNKLNSEKDLLKELKSLQISS